MVSRVYCCSKNDNSKNDGFDANHDGLCRGSKFDGSAFIGSSGEVIDVFGAGTFVENVTAQQTLEVLGAI